MLIKAILLIIPFYVALTFARCPAPEEVAPCTCGDTDIECGSDKPYDLKKILSKLDGVFDTFSLSGGGITEIGEDTFVNVTFDNIRIMGANKLKKIHTNAFRKIAKYVVKSFELHDNEVLVNELPDHNVFEVIAQFVNADKIRINSLKYTEVPSHKTVNEASKLRFLDLGKSFSINKIGDNVFHHLTKLELLALDNQKIEDISSDKIFSFDKSDVNLYIDLSYNPIHGDTFKAGTLSNANRPLTLQLAPTQLSYFDEEVFGPFFDAHPNNTVILGPDQLSCDDCRSYWLIKKGKSALRNRILNLSCIGNVDPFGTKAFQRCHQKEDQ